MLQYRGEILLWSIWGIVSPAVLYAMWSAAADGSEGGVIAGLDQGGFAAYYFAMMVVGHVSVAWDVYQMGYNVRSGRLSPLLLQPILPLWKSLAENVAYKITTLVFVVPMWCLFAWFVRPRFEAEPWQWGLGLAAVFLGGALNYIMSYTVSLIAFWVTKLDGVGEVYMGLGMILGGRFAPLNALPEPLATIALYQPFRWMFAFPTELLIGRIHSPAEALAGLGTQLIWFVSTVVLFRFLWSAAVKRYTAVSG